MIAPTPAPPALPRFAVAAGAVFLGTVATIFAVPQVGDELVPPWLAWVSAPVLYVGGLACGAAVARRRFAGREASEPLWLAAAALFSLFEALAALIFTDRSGQGLGFFVTGGINLLVVLFAVPGAVFFGFLAMRLARRFADGLRAGWYVSGSEARVAAACAWWIAAAAVAAWLRWAFSEYVGFVTLAWVAAAWFAGRGGQRALAAGCVVFAALTIGVFSHHRAHEGDAEKEVKRLLALPCCYDVQAYHQRGALTLAAEAVPGVIRAASDLVSGYGDDHVDLFVWSSGGDLGALEPRIRGVLAKVECRRIDNGSLETNMPFVVRPGSEAPAGYRAKDVADAGEGEL